MSRAVGQSMDIEDMTLSDDARALANLMIAAFTGDVNAALTDARSGNHSIVSWSNARIAAAHAELLAVGVLSSDAPAFAPGDTDRAAVAKEAEFSEWLTAQRIMFGIRPTAERMLQSPDSLTAAQRAWLRGHIARWK